MNRAYTIKIKMLYASSIRLFNKKLNIILMKKIVFLLVACTVLGSSIYSQKGSSCASADSVGSLPYTSTTLTTSSSNNIPANVCGDPDYGGDEYVFKYKPLVNQNVDLTTSNTGAGVALYVTKGCPSGGATCYAKDEEILGNPKLINLIFDIDTTYYIIVAANSYSVATSFVITITGTQIINIDGGIVSISEPVSTCGLNSETVAVQIMNYGKNALSNFNVAYKINNLAPVIEEVNQTIKSESILLYNFSTKADLSVAGTTYNITAYTEITNDGNRNNDTLKKTITNLISVDTIPYLQTFKSGNGGWVSQWDTSANPTDSWQLGIPAKSVINSATPGNKAWTTSLTGTNFTNEASYVLSPCFDFSSATNPYVYMEIFYEAGDGGMNLQYSVNGESWAILGQSGDPTWYNSPLSYSVQGWIGYSTEWVQVYHSLSTLAGLPKVQFRVYFAASDTSEGVAFDDFQITEGMLPTIIAPSVEENAVYPNPATDQVNIDIPLVQQIIVFDMLGNVTEIITGSALSDNGNKIDVSTYNPGVYILQIKTSTGDQNLKLVVK